MEILNKLKIMNQIYNLNKILPALSFCFHKKIKNSNHPTPFFVSKIYKNYQQLHSDLKQMLIGYERKKNQVSFVLLIIVMQLILLYLESFMPGNARKFCYYKFSAWLTQIYDRK